MTFLGFIFGTLVGLSVLYFLYKIFIPPTAAQYADALLHVNEMNYRPSCDEKLQYDYLFHSLRQGDRNIQTSRLLQSFNQNNLELVKQYYNYNTDKAKAALEILTDEQLEYIRQSFFKGGVR